MMHNSCKIIVDVIITSNNYQSFQYGNFWVVAILLQPCKIVTRLLLGFDTLCKLFTTLHNGCEVVVQTVKLHSTILKLLV